MTKKAPFRAADHVMDEPKTYYPFPISVRGELVAWGVVITMFVVCGVLIWQTGALPVWVLIFTLLMVLLAGSIRFSRWMEANTSIEVKPGGIHYASPIRKREFGWSEMQQLIVSRAGSGWRIYVIGKRGGFRFQTDTTLHGTRGREVHTGYIEGGEIVAQILHSGAFGEPEYEDSKWVWKTV